VRKVGGGEGGFEFERKDERTDVMLISVSLDTSSIAVAVYRIVCWYRGLSDDDDLRGAVEIYLSCCSRSCVSHGSAFAVVCESTARASK